MLQRVIARSVRLNYAEYHQGAEIEVPDDLAAEWRRRGLTADVKRTPGRPPKPREVETPEGNARKAGKGRKGSKALETPETAGGTAPEADESTGEDGDGAPQQ